jgi:hypothetical protein
MCANSTKTNVGRVWELLWKTPIRTGAVRPDSVRNVAVAASHRFHTDIFDLLLSGIILYQGDIYVIMPPLKCTTQLN